MCIKIFVLFNADEATDLSAIYERIKNNVHVLNNFKELRMEGRYEQDSLVKLSHNCLLAHTTSLSR